MAGSGQARAYYAAEETEKPEEHCTDDEEEYEEMQNAFYATRGRELNPATAKAREKRAAETPKEGSDDEGAFLGIAKEPFMTEEASLETCKKCGKQFNSRNDLHRHLRNSPCGPLQESPAGSGKTGLFIRSSAVIGGDVEKGLSDYH